MIEVENNANVTLQGGRPEKKNVLGTLVSPCFLWLGARAQGALPLGASRARADCEPPHAIGTIVHPIFGLTCGSRV